MKFEWDEDKNKKNIAKHGISFEKAATIFLNPIISGEDTRKTYGEIRTKTLGLIKDSKTVEFTEVIVIIHTDRQGTIRIISARPANKKERKQYHDWNKK